MGENPADFKWSMYKGYEDHEWDGDVDPLYNAWMALRDNHNVGIESSTGVGKTFLASRIIFWFLDVFPNSLIVTVGPTSRQLRFPKVDLLNKSPFLFINTINGLHIVILHELVPRYQ